MGATGREQISGSFGEYTSNTLLIAKVSYERVCMTVTKLVLVL